MVPESNSPFDSRSLSFAAHQDIPLCKCCNCKTCKRRLDRAKKKGKKQVSLDAVAKQFPREDLIDFSDKYWETLKLYGLFSDQSGEPLLGEISQNAAPRRFRLLGEGS